MFQAQLMYHLPPLLDKAYSRMNSPDDVKVLYITQLVFEFLGHVISCVVTKHTMQTMYLVTYLTLFQIYLHDYVIVFA